MKKAQNYREFLYHFFYLSTYISKNRKHFSYWLAIIKFSNYNTFPNCFKITRNQYAQINTDTQTNTHTNTYTDIKLEDTGNYTCEVRNSQSSVLSNITHVVYVAGLLWLWNAVEVSLLWVGLVCNVFSYATK